MTHTAESVVAEDDEAEEAEGYLDDLLHAEAEEPPAGSLVVDRLSDVGDWEIYRCVDEETASVAASFGLRRGPTGVERMAAVWLGTRTADEPEIVRFKTDLGLPWNNEARAHLLGRLVDDCRARDPEGWPEARVIELAFRDEVEIVEED